MTQSPFGGHFLIPSMGEGIFTTEGDLADIIYGSPHLCVFLTHALVDGASRDAGNTGHTSTLRLGLIMAQITATLKWVPFASGGADGSEIARGVLVPGLGTQLAGGDKDRFLAAIMVKGNLNPEGCCIAANSTYGIGTTGAGLAVRKAFLYNFSFADDFIGNIPDPVSGR